MRGKLSGGTTAVTVNGRFELLRKIGAGGFGTVYEARDRDFTRHVAVKVLDPAHHEVAMREAQALAGLSHPNVVAIFDHGTGPDYRYLVLQLLDGDDLRRACSGKAPAQIIAKYLEAGNGLVAVHAKGLVHRDFKPGNVRIDEKGQAVVVDFGLARPVAELERDAAEVGSFAGTIQYAPPERLIGEPGDERSDQFSFCVALWEALSGVNPFGACSVSTSLDDRVHAILAGVRGAPQGGRRVELALRRGLSVDVGDRFPNMRALIDAIAPPRRSWWKLPAAAGIGGVVVAVVLMQCLPVGGEGSPEFIANTRASCAAPLAIAFARQGNAGRALQSLESAERADVHADASRDLAVASQTVALEFERQSLYPEAVRAWGLAVWFARDAGDHALERRAHDGLYAAAARGAKAPLPRSK